MKPPGIARFRRGPDRRSASLPVSQERRRGDRRVAAIQWVSLFRSADPRELAFWLEYWVAAFSHLLGQSDLELQFVSYEGCCADPRRVLAGLGDLLGIHNREALLRHAERIHAPAPRTAGTNGAPPTLLFEAEKLHRQLMRVARCDRSLDR